MNARENGRGLRRLAAQVALDILSINVAWLMALYVFYDMHVPQEHMARLSRLWPYQTIVCLGAFAALKMYGRLWKYAGLEEVLRVIVGTWAGCFSCYILELIGYTFQKEPNLFLFRRSVYLIAWLLLLVFAAAQRFGPRVFRQMSAMLHKTPEAKSRRKVMIVGAGYTGASLIHELAAHGYDEGYPVIAVDDDPVKANSHIGCALVLHGTENIPAYARQYDIDDILLAIPSAKPERMQRIMQICMSSGCRLRLAARMEEVTDASPRSRMRDVNIADLLCREEVRLDDASIAGYLTGKTVLVTGGGGSIGSELCRQIALFNPKRLVILDVYENNAYELERELEADFKGKFDLVVLIGSIRDTERLDEVFAEWKPDVVFHAAAHKHVPLMEDSPAEAIKNNVFGTWNVAQCASRHHVGRMVQISTDKAVNPTNVMGASKRVTELIIQYMAHHSQTKFMAVRFGNVLGSNGSVIPLFKKMIERGGPVTVTHPDITRYFMTIPEAAQLVLQAGAIGESGNIYVLDMGTPVKILDLARNLIRLAGFTPDEEIKIEFCGLRPGEKLYEELALTEESEAVGQTCHNKIMVLHPLPMDEKLFLAKLDALKSAEHGDPDVIRGALQTLVPSFTAPSQDKAG